MRDSSGCGRGLRQPWLKRTTALATMACIALLATACGGGSSPAASAARRPTRVHAALAYARCMRSHGVPDFPDPDSNGNFHLGNNQHGGGSQGGGSQGGGSNSGISQEPNSVSSQQTAANQVCNHLLNVGPQLNAAQTQHALRQLVKYAQCMRAHGVPDFPDPQTTSGGIGVPGGFTFNTSGLNLGQKSPRYQAASRACQSVATHAKG